MEMNSKILHNIASKAFKSDVKKETFLPISKDQYENLMFFYKENNFFTYE